MGTLVLHNGYSVRRWFNVPRSEIHLAFDEANFLPANDAYYVEWTPNESEQEEAVVVGNKQEILDAYKELEIALARLWPNRYCPSRDEQYTVQVMDDKVVYVG